MLRKNPFIEPCAPTLAKHPPFSLEWVHEVKFDGYRLQLHKNGKAVTLFSKNGNDFTRKFPRIAAAAASIPARSLILDCELVASAPNGAQDFGALLRKDHRNLTVWVFDILFKGTTDLRTKTLRQRRKALEDTMERVDDPLFQLSGWFANPEVLLGVCGTHKLEGIVSKRADRPYVSGKTKNWIKVKCPHWREQNSWRHEFFSKQR